MSNPIPRSAFSDIEKICEHDFVHLETVRQRGERTSFGMSQAKEWKRIDRFYCTKCLEFKDKVQTEYGHEKKPEWWD